MKFDPNNVELKINGVAVDESIMNEQLEALKSEFDFLCDMIDEGEINESTGMKCKCESKDFSLAVDLDMKGE